MGPRASEGQVVAPEQTRLSFLFRDELGDRELPVEVRRADFALIARSRSREQVPLDPGNYIVLSRFPDGSELRGEVSIKPGQGHTSVLLKPVFDDSKLFGDRHDSERVRGIIDAIMPFYESGVDPPDHPRNQTHLDILGVDWAHSLPVKHDWFRPEINETGTFRIPAQPPLDSSEMRLLRLVQRWPGTDKTVVLWPLPDSAFETARFWVVDSPLGLEVHLDNDQADLALGYLRRGALGEAASAVASGLLSAHEMLSRQRWDPLAAALGAYLLHRDRKLSAKAEEWVQGLEESNPTFPDTYCLRAEIHARRQEHEQAFASLLELSALGLPFFSEGLTLACSRLASYLRSERFLQSIDEVNRTRAFMIFTRLNWLGAHRVIGEPVLTLEGFDPLDSADIADLWSLQPDEGIDPRP